MQTSNKTIQTKKENITPAGEELSKSERVLESDVTVVL